MKLVHETCLIFQRRLKIQKVSYFIWHIMLSVAVKVITESVVILSVVAHFKFHLLQKLSRENKDTIDEELQSC